MKRTTYPANLACPLDASALIQEQGQLCCKQGHRFDIARQGYVNLLPVQHKKSKAPGDNKAMVAARTQFLNTQHYQPIANQLNHTLQSLLTDAARHYYVLDAGCGDGYYLDQLLKGLPSYNMTAIGVDISKEAILAAAKRNANVAWLVAGNKQLPVLERSVDVIISVFGFPSINGFAQALTEGGYVILVEPNTQHLIELRRQLYAEVNESANRNQLITSSLFTVTQTHNLAYQTKPLTNGELTNLLKMTPHFYRAPKKAVESLCRQSELSVTVDVNITVCRKLSDS